MSGSAEMKQQTWLNKDEYSNQINEPPVVCCDEKTAEQFPNPIYCCSSIQMIGSGLPSQTSTTNIN